MTIEIHLSGPAVTVVSSTAEDFLKEIAEADPKSQRLDCDENESKGDPLAITALILSIPGAVLATMDLVERAKVAERIRRLLDKVRGTKGTATLQIDTKPPLDLKTTTEDEVMDFIAKT